MTHRGKAEGREAKGGEGVSPTPSFRSVRVDGIDTRVYYGGLGGWSRVRWLEEKFVGSADLHTIAVRSRAREEASLSLPRFRGKTRNSTQPCRKPPAGEESLAVNHGARTSGQLRTVFDGNFWDAGGVMRIVVRAD